MSNPNDTHEKTNAPASLAQWADPDDCAVELAAIETYLATPDGGINIDGLMEREAFFQLVMAPFESSSIEALCRRVGEILGLLRDASERDAVAWAFERAVRRVATGVKS